MAVIPGTPRGKGSMTPSRLRPPSSLIDADKLGGDTLTAIHPKQHHSSSAPSRIPTPGRTRDTTPQRGTQKEQRQRGATTAEEDAGVSLVGHGDESRERLVHPRVSIVFLSCDPPDPAGQQQQTTRVINFFFFFRRCKHSSRLLRHLTGTVDRYRRCCLPPRRRSTSCRP